MYNQRSILFSRTLLAVFATTSLVEAASLSSATSTNNSTCRYLTSDAGWPSNEDWAALNSTVGGNLIQGVPIGHSCYGASPDATACAKVQETWEDLDPFLEDPVNVIESMFQGTTCSPFYGPLSVDSTTKNATCTLGRLASYAINVTDASSVIAGVEFARKNNIRLIIKNTGHDILGRSTGQASLSLWTHHLKDYSFFQYESENYTGPAARIGAGVQVLELYKAAAAQGRRVTGGGCATVGAAGGWVQSGGHGPLASAYGLGADNTLAFEVVTTDGRHLNASRAENADLFWALSGGGPSNYAIVLSATMKTYPDGAVAGATLTFTESDDDKFFAAVEAWERHLMVLDTIPGLYSSVTLQSGYFGLDYITLPDVTGEELSSALAPFQQTLESLNITATVNVTVHDTFLAHYEYYEETAVYTRNVTVGNRLIPRDLVTNDTWLPQLTDIYREILAAPDSFAYIIANNVTHARAGGAPGDNPVVQAWRDSLFLTTIGVMNEPQATAEDLAADQALANKWQLDLRGITPGGASYMNEATYDFPYWKEDYYAEYYDDLVDIKMKYDPDYILWTQPAAGSDAYVLEEDGHLCRA